jgi:hypothetical protein
MTDQTTDGQTTAPPQFSRPSPLTASERVQRTRERRKKDLLLVTLEIRASERAALIRQGLLAPDKARDKWATRDALYSFLEKVLVWE